MVQSEGDGSVTSSYIGSLCVLLSALFVSCRSRQALILIITITVMKTTTLTIIAVAMELIDIMYALLVSKSCMPSVSMGCKFTLIGSPPLPVIFPQTTVCTANMHTLPLVGISVQVAMVWLVVVGQLPQFDARML